MYLCENSEYLKRTTDDSVIPCDEIINIMDSVSTDVTNTLSTNETNIIPANITSTVSINSNDKKARYKMDCYILLTFLLVIILLFIVAIICYHYAKHWSKQNIIMDKRED